MPIDVTCSGCQIKFQVKDEFAGRKVRCSKCEAVIVIPSVEAVAEFPDEWGHDPAFQRDKFLLHQKHFSINTRYAICDEDGKDIMQVVRPTHLFRSLVAMFGVMLVLIVSIIGVVAGGLSLHPMLGDAGTFAFVLFGTMLTAFFTIFTYLLLAPKRHITFYRDDSKDLRLLEVLQEQKMAIRMMTYTVRDADGQEIGRFRKDYLANILRKKWDGFDAQGEHLYVIREDSIILSLLRRLLGSFYGLLRTNFVIHQVGDDGKDGPLLGEFNRKFTLLDRYVLDCSHDRTRSMDRRLAIAIGVLLDTAESR
jgi:uncharacterized protein YxjI